jgi:HSP90 family molecular chaperone
MRKVSIKLNTANALRWLGSLYRNPADAIKEHVSNAIDEHLKAKGIGKELPVCKVTFTLKKDEIIIEYPYGMSKEEFEGALQRVAESVKKSFDFKQIGQLGIGMFSFFQIGKRCIFFSKKDKGAETVKVTLREGSDDAEFETAIKRESLSSPGIKIIISGLLFDPTKPRGPLSRLPHINR